MVEDDEPERSQQSKIDVIVLMSNGSSSISPNLDWKADRKLCNGS